MSLQSGSIITVRLIMFISSTIISTQQGYYAARPCGQVENMLGGDRNATLHKYPECQAYYSGENPDQHALIRADMDGDSGAEAAAALGLTFGAAVWLGLAMHAIGIEIYVS
jgi:hypothetical protein